MINFAPFLLKRSRRNVTVVITMHGFWEQSKLFKIRCLPMLRSADGIIYVDRRNRQSMLSFSGLQESAVAFVPISSNIVPIDCSQTDRERWRAQLGFSESDVVVAHFAGFAEMKGTLYLLEAIDVLRKTHGLSIKMLAIGGYHGHSFAADYERRIDVAVNQAQSQKWLVIVDRPSADRVSQCFHASDLAACPLTNGVSENSGTLLASLVHGLPSISTFPPDGETSFADKYGVLLTRPRDASGLAEAIMKLASSGELRTAITRKAKAAVEELSWPRIAKLTLDFFKTLTASGSR